MARPTEQLTVVEVKNAKPKESPYKLADGGGLYLLVTPEGGRYWRLDYRFAEKRKTLALGTFPEVSLSQARKQMRAAKDQLMINVDPGYTKKRLKEAIVADATSTFEVIAREWFGFMQKRWTEQHANQTISSLETHIFPHIGNLPVTAISGQDIIRTLKRLEAVQRLETLRRLYQRCGAIFRYAVDLGRIKVSPMPSTKWFDAPVVENHARLADGQVQQFLKDLELASIHVQTKLALKLMALVFLRTGELRMAEWAHIDFEKALWTVPPENTKMGRAHLVPLSQQAIKLLRAQHRLTGNWKYVFAGRDPRKPMSSGTLIMAVYRMGLKGETTVHGFRGTASTVLNEKGFRKDVIERQLAHSDKDAIRAAYNHAEYLDERRIMMQWWADYLAGGLEIN
jgi:integrase